MSAVEQLGPEAGATHADRAVAIAGLPNGSGEMAGLVRAFDWSQTPLGPIERWPQSLRTVVNILLTSRYAMWMAWGPELTMIYNDSYRPTLGIKHPWALGSRASEVWAEIWPDIGPRIDTVLNTGTATYDEGLLLFLERSGFPEETYHTFSYSPLADDTGAMTGMLCVVTEETGRVIGERRVETLRDVAAALAKTNSEEEVLQALGTELARNQRDLPFTLTYLFDEGGAAHLVCTSGISESDEVAVVQIAAGSDYPWPAARMYQQAAPRLMEDLSTLQTEGVLPGGDWNKPVTAAMVVPLRQQGQDRPAGFMVSGINPYRHYDAAYSGFLDLLAGQVTAAVGNARAYEAERRRALALAELDRAKTAFFSNVSHEFRTPLTLMLGPLEELLASAEGRAPREQEQLLIAHRNSLRLLKLVNSLLDFSRIEAGRLRASYLPVDLSALTVDLASNFRSAMQSAGLEFIVDCAPLPEPVFVDREMWEKIVLNLLSNAFKFTFEGSVTVRLRTSGEHAVLTIADTGTGIPEAEIPHLFERFHRVEGAKGRSYEGTGIGLALVQELVNLHGGSISVASTPTVGSSFTVSLRFGTAHLPKEHIGSLTDSQPSMTARGEAFTGEALSWLSEQPETRRTISATVGGMAHSGTEKIGRAQLLFADDNADMRDYVSRVLGPDYDLVAVGDGISALEQARRAKPDLILSDVMMPRLDGFGLLRALRSDPHVSDVPIIMLSARAGEESRVEGLQAGADDYLVKPFSARELIARVSSALELSRARRSVVMAARDNERRIRSLFQQAPSFTCILRGPEHVFEFANDAYMRMVGEGRDLMGKAVREAVPEATGQGFFELLDEVYRTGKPFTGMEIPLRLERRPGEPLVDSLVDFICQPIADESGQVTGIFVEGFEVTQRVRAQAALRESEDRYRTLFESIDEGFCILEAIPANATTPSDFRYIAVNPAHEVQSGVPTKVGETVRDVIPTEAQDWIDVFDNILRTGEPVREQRGLLVQGRVLDLYAFRLEDETKRHVGLIFTDVTARKRAEAELLRANQDLERFAYSASHDLQEPLRSVSIYSELLEKRYRDRLDGQALEFLGYLRGGALRMEALIRDLLAYTHAGAVDIESEDTDAGEVLGAVLSDLSSGIAASGANITSGPLPRVPINSMHLKQLFQNLISNAMKYRSSAVRPEVDIRAEWQNGAWLFSVSDNGIGIDPQYKERIFGLFKRLHTGDEYPGTGIGLAICQRIVERYQGSIWVESRPREGSTFRFTIPA